MTYTNKIIQITAFNATIGFYIKHKINTQNIRNLMQKNCNKHQWKKQA